MKTIEASQLRQEISDALNTVAFAGERIAINRHGKRVAVLVSVEDLKLLEAWEEQQDVKLAKKALKEKVSVPWTQAKKKLGLD
jgi:prevent-host-death family protein